MEGETGKTSGENPVKVCRVGEPPDSGTGKNGGTRGEQKQKGAQKGTGSSKKKKAQGSGDSPEGQDEQADIEGTGQRGHAKWSQNRRDSLAGKDRWGEASLVALPGIGFPSFTDPPFFIWSTCMQYNIRFGEMCNGWEEEGGSEDFLNYCC